MKNELGVAYVAFGRPYLAMTLLSAATLRKTNPDIPICIITNASEKKPMLDFWNEKKDHYIWLNMATKDNRQVKINVNKYSPFKKTIYLDCDTVITGDLSNASLFLDHFDIAIRPNPKSSHKPGKGDQKILNGAIVNDLPHFNGGVFMFNKNKKTDDFFNIWSNTFKKLALENDQVSLLETIFKSSTRILALDHSWNFTSFYSVKRKQSPVRVIHYTSRISPVIKKQIIYFDKKIPAPDGDDSLNNFFRKRTEYIKKKYGIIKYIGLRLLWLLFP